MNKMIAAMLVLCATDVFAADVLIFNNGVEFNHKGHQTDKVGDCTVCHDESVGKIEGFGKEWAHKRCIICHELLIDGRNTGCRECHKTLGYLKR